MIRGSMQTVLEHLNKNKFLAREIRSNMRKNTKNCLKMVCVALRQELTNYRLPNPATLLMFFIYLLFMFAFLLQ